MPLSLFSKVLKDRSISEAIRIAADAGYDAIELIGSPHLSPDIPDRALRDLAQQAKDDGVEVCNLATYLRVSGHASRREADATCDTFRRWLEVAAIFGCPRVRIWPTGMPAADVPPDVWDNDVTQYRDLALDAQPQGVTVICEIHGGCLFESLDSTLHHVQAVGQPNVGITYDPGNLPVGHVWGPDAFDRVADRVHIIHVRDQSRGTDGSRRFELFGEGELDYGPLFAHLHQRGYDGYLSAECHREPDASWSSDAIARREHDAIRRLWQETGGAS